MMKLRRSVATLAVALAILPLVTEASTLSVPGRTPKSAVAVVSINDTKTMWGNISASPLRAPMDKLLNSPTVQQQEGFTKFLGQKADAEAKLGFPLTADSILGNVVRGVDVYMTKATTEGGEPGMVTIAKFASEEQAGKVADQIVAETERAAAEAAAANAQATAPASTPAAAKKAETKDINGTKVRYFADHNLYIATAGPILFVATNEQGISETLSAQDDAPLLAGDAFKAAFEPLKGIPSQMWMFGDGTAIADAAASGTFIPPQAAQGFEGMRNRTVAGAIEFHADRTKMTVFEPASGYNSIEKAMVSAKTGPAAANRFIPSEGLMTYSLSGMDMVKMMDAMNKAQTSDNPSEAQMAAGFIMGMSMAEMSLGGLSIQNDLIPALGSEFGASIENVTFDMQNRTGNANLVLIAQAKDSAKIGDAMGKLETAITDQIKMQFSQSGAQAPADLKVFQGEEYKGAKLRTFSPPPAMGPLPIPISPTYTVTTDGFLLIGLNKGDVTNAIDRSTGKGGNFTQAPLMATASAHVQKDAGQVMTFDLAKVVSFVRGSFGPMMTAGMEPAEGEAFNALMDTIAAANKVVFTSSLRPEGKLTEYLIMMK